MMSGFGFILQEERLEGRKEAEEKAKKKAYDDKIKSVKNLIKIGLSNSQISEAMDIPEEKVEDLRN